MHTTSTALVSARGAPAAAQAPLQRWLAGALLVAAGVVFAFYVGVLEDQVHRGAAALPQVAVADASADAAP